MQDELPEASIIDNSGAILEALKFSWPLLNVGAVKPSIILEHVLDTAEGESRNVREMENDKPQCNKVGNMVQSVGVGHAKDRRIYGEDEEKKIRRPSHIRCDSRHHHSTRQGLHQKYERHNRQNIMMR